MKNLTEGEKMVWAAAYAAAIITNEIDVALIRAHNAVAKLQKETESDDGFIVYETAKEVLK